ncbi:MAG: hypothetical protein U0401_05685 [Anaerolineae bacterium]
MRTPGCSRPDPDAFVEHLGVTFALGARAVLAIITEIYALSLSSALEKGYSRPLVTDTAADARQAASMGERP